MAAGAEEARVATAAGVEAAAAWTAAAAWGERAERWLGEGAARAGAEGAGESMEGKAAGGKAKGETARALRVDEASGAPAGAAKARAAGVVGVVGGGRAVGRGWSSAGRKMAASGLKAKVDTDGDGAEGGAAGGMDVGAGGAAGGGGWGMAAEVIPVKRGRWPEGKVWGEKGSGAGG